MCGGLVRVPKTIGKTLWHQRLLVSSAIEGTIGVALTAIGILSIIGIAAALSIGQVGSISLLAAGGALISLALLSIAIKGGFIIKKKCAASGQSNKTELNIDGKIQGADPQVVFLTKFKNMHVAFVNVVTVEQEIFEMNKFEQENPTDDYRVIKLSYGSANTWIIGISTKETRGTVKWFKFEVNQIEWRAKELTLKTTSQNQLLTVPGPFKTKIETQDLLYQLSDDIYNILERKIEKGN